MIITKNIKWNNQKQNKIITNNNTNYSGYTLLVNFAHIDHFISLEVDQKRKMYFKLWNFLQSM